MSIEKKTPVAVIGFLRDKVLAVTLEGLAAADGVLERDIYVYLSSPRTAEEKVKTDRVRKVVEEIRRDKLPNIVIVERTENLGCSLNIRYAIDHTIIKTGRVIVIEEDVLVSRTFFRYMDAALDRYEYDKRIWGIDGYKNPFLRVPKDYPYDVYLNPRNMVCGWGTWLDRWESTDFGTERWETFKSNPENMKRMEMAGSDIAKMVDAVAQRGFNAWDAQVSFNLVEKGLYCVEPRYSLTKNIGYCTIGATHCSRPHGYYEKQKIYNFMPNLQTVGELLEVFPLMADRFRYSVSDHRPLPFAWRCVMRVLKHFIGPVNNDPKEVRR